MGKFFGKYRARVINNKDPKKMGRIKVECPKVLGKFESEWCLPCFPYGADGIGTIQIPREGYLVWVEFEEGDPDKPIWTGTIWKQGLTPFEDEYELTDRKRIFKTESGHKIVFSDVEEHEYEDEEGNTVSVEADEHIELTTHSGHRVRFHDVEDEEYVEIETKSGHKVKFNDVEGEESVRLDEMNGNSFTANKDGTVLLDKFGNKTETKDAGISIQDKFGNKTEKSDSGIKIQDKNGNIIELNDGGITITSSADVKVTDANGNSVSMTGGGITVSAGADVTVSAGGSVTISGSSINLN